MCILYFVSSVTLSALTSRTASCREYTRPACYSSAIRMSHYADLEASYEEIELEEYTGAGLTFPDTQRPPTDVYVQKICSIGKTLRYF